jgi:hypothetical protein
MEAIAWSMAWPSSPKAVVAPFSYVSASDNPDKVPTLGQLPLVTKATPPLPLWSLTLPSLTLLSLSLRGILVRGGGIGFLPIDPLLWLHP